VKKTLAVMIALLAVGCMSTSGSMMSSDRGMVSSSGSMTMMNTDGTSRPMTDAEMQAHMSMMMNDPRYASMMTERCTSAGTMASSSSMSGTSGTSGGAGMSSSGSGMSNTGMSNSTGMANSSMSSSMSGSGTSMMVMNGDGTTRAMTDAEYRDHLNMMMKNSQMSQSMMTRCNGNGM